MTNFIHSYVHKNKVGVLLEVSCLDDATVKTQEFLGLVQDLALHIIAFAPEVIEPRPLAEVVALVDARSISDAASKESDRSALLNQPFVKNSDKTVREVIKEAEAVLSEKIRVVRFARIVAGET